MSRRNANINVWNNAFKSSGNSKGRCKYCRKGITWKQVMDGEKVAWLATDRNGKKHDCRGIE